MTVIFSAHAHQQMALRGATETEVRGVIERGGREAALRDRLKSRLIFNFNQTSPVNNRLYRFKTVEVIWKEESDNAIIITVLVYYSNEERSS